MSQEGNKPQIRYVCLSDMHFGAENSLLTVDVTELPRGHHYDLTKRSSYLKVPSPVLVQLVACLRALIQAFPREAEKQQDKEQSNKERKKPTLILNGDILELAVATDNDAVTVFECFTELIMPNGEKPGLFERIILVPGNHDHHLWETAREEQYAKYLKQRKPECDLEPPWHVTVMFEKKYLHRPLPSSSLLTQAKERATQRIKHLQPSNVGALQLPINLAYPNWGLLREDSQQCIIFTHGHYIESMYTLISTLKTMLFPHSEKPRQIWDLEAENFAWIDFLWSALGRSNNNRSQLESLYEQIQDGEELDRLLSRLAKNLAQKYDLLNRRVGFGAQALKQVTDAGEAKLLYWLLKTLFSNIAALERHQGEDLSPEAKRGLYAYVSGPLREQFVQENNKHLPNDVTLIFGHTHKPFQEPMHFQGFTAPVKVYNSGGWVVDAQPIHGGAIILIDESLNAVSLNMYDEKENRFTPKVESLDPNQPFCKQIKDQVDPTQEPWRQLSQTLEKAVCTRRHLLWQKRGQGL
jgi:predicted phosphodiesterase